MPRRATLVLWASTVKKKASLSVPTATAALLAIRQVLPAVLHVLLARSSLLSGAVSVKRALLVPSLKKQEGLLVILANLAGS